MTQARIIYTLTDEAPALATYSLLPIIQAFARLASIDVQTRDISLASRISRTGPLPTFCPMARPDINISDFPFKR